MFARRALSARAGLGLAASISKASTASATAAAARVTATSRTTMPLRAKIMASGGEGGAGGVGAARSFSQKISASSADQIWQPVEGDEPEDVVFDSIYGLRSIELNRPKKLNSLNGSMIRKIGPRLIEWEKSDMANVIVMKGAGAALCAGGDVAALALDNQKGPEGQARSDEYFALEYKLDHLIGTLQTPYIAFMDGFTMGGGVGLSLHAPFRIATERSVFAMPETTIGFFPDVGASFFLPRLPGALGTYLALTSDRLTGANLLYTGIATHYMHSTTLRMLEGRLAELRFRDWDTRGTRLHLVNDTINEYVTGLPPMDTAPMQLHGAIRKAIDRIFSRNSVAEILDLLQQIGRNNPAYDWAQKTLATLHARSPTSVHVALRQLRLSRDQQWSLADTFRREHQIAARFMRHPDFVEGVSAQLIRKDKKPVWQPASLEAIAASGQDVAAPFFEVSHEIPPLNLLTDRDYAGDYPFSKVFGVPTEEAVRSLVKKKHYSKKQIVDAFVQQYQGKVGVREVVDEIVERCTRAHQTPFPDAREWIAPDVFAESVVKKQNKKTEAVMEGEVKKSEQ